ncbi:MAG: hypothetical protein WBB76_03055 [Gaiellaceae bacterium]
MGRRGIAALLLATVALAGCGGGGKNASSSGSHAVSGDPVALATAKTSHVGSVEADFAIAGPAVQGHGTGVFNTGQSASGQVGMTVTVNGRPLKIDMVLTGKALYMRSPAFSQAGLTGAKEWVKFDLARIAGQARQLGLGGLLGESSTPTGALAYLRGSSGHLTKVGTETVRGEAMTHYKVTVDLELAAKRASGSARQSLRQAIGTTGARKLQVDVWIDGKGYIRKLTLPGKGQAPSVTIELHDFGSHVSISAPPSYSVVDVTKLRQGG